MDIKQPLPPFTEETAIQKVRMAEDAWNTRDPAHVVVVYTEDTQWRNRAEFPVGRAEVQRFLERKWARELDYRLIKELWGLRRQPHCSALRLRMARRLGSLVPLLWQRKLGVQRAGPHDAPLREYQRPADCGCGT